MTEATAQAGRREDTEFAPCPRHGTRCYPESRDDLPQRLEVAIGLATGAIRESGPDGVRELRDRILAIIEDHDAAQSRWRPEYETYEVLVGDTIYEECGTRGQVTRAVVSAFAEIRADELIGDVRTRRISRHLRAESDPS